MADQTANFAVGVILTPPSPGISGTTITLQPGHGTRFPPVPFNATVWSPVAPPSPSTAEVVRVTGIAGDALTVMRGAESSTPRTIVQNDLIAQTLTKAVVANFAKRDEPNTFAGDVTVTGTVKASVGLCDYGRTTPVGIWTDVPFNASNFVGFTVGSTSLNAYTIIGKTLLWHVSLLACNVPTGVASLNLIPPLAITPTYTTSGSTGRCLNGGNYQQLSWLFLAGESVVRLQTIANVPFKTGATELFATMALRLP